MFLRCKEAIKPLTIYLSLSLPKVLRVRKTEPVEHDRKSVNNGALPVFGTHETTPVLEAHSNEQVPPTPSDADIETHYITPVFFRKFALWLLDKDQEPSD